MSKKIKNEATPHERVVKRLKGAATVLGANYAAVLATMGLTRTNTVVDTKQIANKMGLKIPFIELDNKSPAAGYDPYSHEGAIFGPSNAREAYKAHEVGHLKNREMIHSLASKITKNPGNIRGLRGAGWFLAKPSIISGISALAAGAAANDKDDDAHIVAPVANAALHTPVMLEEGLANARAVKHLVKSYGVGKGLLKSLPLVPAYSSYLAMGALPLGIALHRRYKDKQKTANINREITDMPKINLEAFVDEAIKLASSETKPGFLVDDPKFVAKRPHTADNAVYKMDLEPIDTIGKKVLKAGSTPKKLAWKDMYKGKNGMKVKQSSSIYRMSPEVLARFAGAVVGNAVAVGVGHHYGKNQKKRGEDYSFGVPQGAAALLVPGGLQYQIGRYIGHRNKDE